jgi:DNA-binding CsgD family transcriptional regulator
MASIKMGDLKETVDAFAAASLDPSLWENAMTNAALATGSVGALLLPVQGRIPGVPVSASVAELVSTYFQEGWWSQDPRERGVRTMVRRGVMSDFDFVAPGEVEHSSFYQDFLGRFGLRWMAGIKIAAGKDLWCLAIQRSIEQGPFSGDDLVRLTECSAALSCSAEVARALGNTRGNAALEAFQISSVAAVLLDRYAKITLINTSAEKLLGRDLKIIRRRIISARSSATAELESALHALLWRPDELAPKIPVILPRADGRPILAYPCRLPSVAIDCFTPSRLAVVFLDLGSRPSLAKADIGRAFRLTPAEARVCELLLAGEPVEQLAETLGISYETARNTLKRVFHKTDCHRQGELVSLLSRFSQSATSSDRSE